MVLLYENSPVVFLGILIKILGALEKGEKHMEEIKLTYHEGEDGLLYPDLKFPDKEKVSLARAGKYGRMAAKYLKEAEPTRYRALYRFGMLAEKMEKVNEEAQELLEKLMNQYLEKHKPQNPNDTMEMWKLREQAKMTAEEVVLHQIVYQYH